MVGLTVLHLGQFIMRSYNHSLYTVVREICISWLLSTIKKILNVHKFLHVGVAVGLEQMITLR